MDYSESQIEALLNSIWAGTTNVNKLPIGLYEAIAAYLVKGVDLGFSAGKTKIIDSILLEELRLNTYLFAGAKTFNYVLSAQILVDEQRLIGKKEFIELARTQYDLHNDTWLKAEYDTAIGQAQTAREWNDIVETGLEMVEYVTVEDANTDEACIVKNGVIRSVNDPFWDTESPLTHYNCRCLIRGVYEGEETPIPKNLIPNQSIFAGNPGKSGEIFNNKHPYFAEIPNQYGKLAKENFNLPLP